MGRVDVRLYDLASTYFESDPPPAEAHSKHRFGVRNLPRDLFGFGIASAMERFHAALEIALPRGC